MACGQFGMVFMLLCLLQIITDFKAFIKRKGACKNTCPLSFYIVNDLFLFVFFVFARIVDGKM